MTPFQAIFTAIIQGITELFPVSSLGHAVILPGILGWNIDQHAPSFLPFLVVLHLGTAAALLIYFWRDWIELLFAVLGRSTENPRGDGLRLLGLIIVATIPAVILGFAFEKILRGLFGVPLIAAVFLTVNGFLLFAGERLRRRVASARAGRPIVDDGEASFAGLRDLTWRGALMIGLWQCTALIPGISRSGATMVGGLLAGLHHKESARFSFLIATPIIFGAAVLEVPKLLHSETSGGITGLSIVAGIIAGITAYASIAFLMHYFRKHDFEALDPFAWYCWLVGAATLGWLYFR
jgi:undecaprenyl-diphosphatase